MPDLVVGYDPLQPIGERLAPEIRAEIAVVAPSTVMDDSITEPKFFEGAVSTRALAVGAVTSTRIGDGEVKTVNIADNAVTTSKIAPDSVGPNEVAPGVPTVRDSSNNAISMEFIPITAPEYAALTTPDPSAWYMIEGS